MGFLSTLPARGATLLADAIREGVNISIHAPREGSDLPTTPDNTVRLSFLSTLPARGATGFVAIHLLNALFLSTLPARGATVQLADEIAAWEQFLSTLPARGATDLLLQVGHIGEDFYPRSPRGERQTVTAFVMKPQKFLSTLPARGATVLGCPDFFGQRHFYPRSPRGERL